MDQLIGIPGTCHFIKSFENESGHGAAIYRIDGSYTGIDVGGHSTEQNAIIAVTFKYGRSQQQIRI